ncbi:ATP-binding protein [Candidatus Azambacteria bacterium]|nr:ATP-binding protein [Candidatus Azambacteria bacterium]
MEYVNRKIEIRIMEAAKTMPIIGILGPRQSGKTTLARNLFKDFLYVNLEFPDDRVYAERDPRGFLSQADKMIIDEIQQVPELFSYIQGFVDEYKDRKYVLTGSSNFTLLPKISQSLAGRIALFTVLPFALSELGTVFRGRSFSSNDVQFSGFYPRVVIEKNNPVLWYQGYIQTYLERDVQQITAIHLMDRFYHFIKILAARTGSIINYTELAAETGVSLNTVRGWFSVLVSSYIVYIVPPYFANISKRLVKSPRCYFYDPGLLCTLLGIRDSRHLDMHILSGQIFENFVISEMIKNEYIIHQTHTLFYYRDHDGLEVDIVREKNNMLELFEIKRNNVYKTEFAHNMRTLERLLPNVLKKTVVYGGDQTMQHGDISIMSWRDLK